MAVPGSAGTTADSYLGIVNFCEIDDWRISLSINANVSLNSKVVLSELFAKEYLPKVLNRHETAALRCVAEVLSHQRNVKLACVTAGQKVESAQHH